MGNAKNHISASSANLPNAAWTDQIEAAQSHFGQVLEEQLERVERLKQQRDWLACNIISPIKIGLNGGDGIRPSRLAALSSASSSWTPLQAPA